MRCIRITLYLPLLPPTQLTESTKSSYRYRFLILPHVVAVTGSVNPVPSESKKSIPRRRTLSKFRPSQADPNAVCAFAFRVLEVRKSSIGWPVTVTASVPSLYLPGGNCVPDPLAIQISGPAVHRVPSPQRVSPVPNAMLSVHAP